MNLIIDSSAFNPLTSEDFTIYLKNRIPSHIKWVRLKSVTFISTINIYPLLQSKDYIYINCDIIDTDMNLFNSNRSPILSMMLIPRSVKGCVNFKFDNSSFKKLKSAEFTSIRLYLTNYDQTLVTAHQSFAIVYELEFC